MTKEDIQKDPRLANADHFDNVTPIPDDWKKAAVKRLLGAKLEHEDSPCGLEDIIGALALREHEDTARSNFLQESPD